MGASISRIGPSELRGSDPTADLPHVAPTLDDLFRAYAPYVAAVVLRILGRDEEVEDLVQDVFLEATRGIASLRNPEAAKAWLATVAVRVARKRLRSRRLLAFLGIERGYDYSQIADLAATPADGLVLARVYAALDRLPAADRIAWTLRYVQGERLEKVARLCSCSLATAKRRIASAGVAIQEAVGT